MQSGDVKKKLIETLTVQPLSHTHASHLCLLQRCCIGCVIMLVTCQPIVLELQANRALVTDEVLASFMAVRPLTY